MPNQSPTTVLDYDSGYDDPDDGIRDGSSQTTNASSVKKRRRATNPSNTSNTPRETKRRAEMYALVTRLDLDSIFERHYAIYKDDLEQFLDDHTDVHTARNIRRKVAAEPQANIDRKLSLAALACFDAAQILDERHKFDTLRKAFLVLAMWDVFVYLQTSHNIRVTSRISKKAVNLLVNTRDSSLTIAEQKLLRKNFGTMIAMGRRIDNMCAAFGEGSLFYVAGVLSENLWVRSSGVT